MEVPDFKKKLIDKSPVIDMRGGKLIWDIVLNKKEFNCEYAILKDFTFSRLHFDNTGDINAGLKLINCQGKGLEINGCEITHYNQDLDFPNGAGIILENCKFEYLIVENNPKFKRGLYLSNNCEIGYIRIQNSNFDEAHIYLDSSVVNEPIDIFNITTNLGIKFQDSTINAESRFFNVNGGSISYQKCTVNADTFIDESSIDINFNESTFKNDLSIRGCKINSLTTYGDTFEKGLALDVKHEKAKGFINEIYIQNASTGQGIEFNGYQTVLKNIEIPCTNLLSGSFKINNFEIEKCRISGLNKNSNLIFNGCRFEKLRLIELYNQSGLTFSHCKAADKQSIFEILTSDIGDTLFINFNFRDFYDLTIKNSIVSGSRFSGGHLFTSNQLYSRSRTWPLSKRKSLSSLERFYRQKREVYKQFRHAANNQGDNILSKNFKAEELKCYWAELKCNKKWYQRDRLVLAFSWTNDMGLNWSKPIWLALGITLLFYFPMLISASKELELASLLHPSKIDWGGSLNIYWNHLWVFLRMLNPARLFSRIFSEPPIDSNWIYLWDIIHRIILAFLIFQILTAFRKYIK